MGGWAVEHSEGHLPFLDYDDHGSKEQDQHHQPADTSAQDQAHVLGMLGHLQRVLGILAGS